MTNTPLNAAPAPRGAPGDARTAAARLERLKAQIATVQEAIGALNALLTEEIDAQQHALAAQPVPVEAGVRAEYATICHRLDAARSAYDALAMGLDETLRRHSEGRIDEVTFARSQRAAEEALRARATELAELDRLRARFLAEFPEVAGPVRAAPLADEAPPDAAYPEGDGRTPIRDVPAAVASAGGLLTQATVVAAPVPASMIETDEVDAPPAAGTAVVPEPSAALIEVHATSSGAAHAVGRGLVIGRAIDNGLRVLDPSVSRQHASIALDSGDFVLEDRHSQNGTFVNGERIRRRVLQDGDRISIGEAEFVFRLTHTSRNAPSRDTAAAALGDTSSA